MRKATLIDSCFLIKFLKADDPLHENAKEYFKHCLLNNCEMWISTISIAEYCVRGSIDDIPFRNLKILPFNVDHASIAGHFMETVLRHKNKLPSDISRVTIPNDCKLLAQAFTHLPIDSFMTSDTNCKKMYDIIKSENQEIFDFVDISISLTQNLGGGLFEILKEEGDNLPF